MNPTPLALHIETMHKSNTVRTVAVFVGITAGIISIIYLVNQIKLTRMQLEKFQREEEKRDKTISDELASEKQKLGRAA